MCKRVIQTFHDVEYHIEVRMKSREKWIWQIMGAGIGNLIWGSVSQEEKQCLG